MQKYIRISFYSSSFIARVTDDQYNREYISLEILYPEGKLLYRNKEGEKFVEFKGLILARRGMKIIEFEDDESAILWFKLTEV